MAFDPSAPFGEVRTSSGKKYLVQSNVIYDAKTFAQIVTGLDSFEPSDTAHNFQRELITKKLPIGVDWDYIVARRSIVNNVKVDLWEGPTGLYVFPPNTGIQMQAVSSSASDAAAGTGVQILHIHALDNNFNPLDILVTMNGVTPVLTTQTNIARINGIHAEVVGSNGTSVGNISLQSVGGVTTYAYITAGDSVARHGIYTMRAGMTGYISQWNPSSGSAGIHFARMTLQATSHLGTQKLNTFLVQDAAGTLNGGYDIKFAFPIPLPEKCDLKLECISDNVAANVAAAATVFLWMEPNF